MVVEAPVVKVDGAAGGDQIVGNAHLGVAEARRVFEDPHAAAGQSIVIGAREAVNDFFVRDARRNDANIHAAPGRQGQGMAHFIRDDQIGRDEPDIVLRPLGNADVNILADRPVIHGRIRVGLDEAFCSLSRRFDRPVQFRQVPGKVPVVPVPAGTGIPHLQEGDRQAPDSIPLEPDSGILPEAEGLRPVEILVGQVVAAGKAHLAVDDRDLAVVAVVEEEVQAGAEGIEDTALDPVFLCSFYKIRIDEAQTPHVVVEDTYLDARAGPLLEDLLQLMPALRVLDGVVFHENEVLCLCQVSLLGLETLFAVVVVGDLRIGIDGVARLSLNIADQSVQPAVSLLHLCCHFLIAGQHGQQDLVDLIVSDPHFPGVAVQADQQVKRRPEDGRQHDQHDPGHPDRCRLVAAVDSQHQGHGQKSQDMIDPGRPLSHIVQEYKQEPHFQQDRQHGKYHPENAVFNGGLLLDCLPHDSVFDLTCRLLFFHHDISVFRSFFHFVFPYRSGSFSFFRFTSFTVFGVFRIRYFSASIFLI